MAAVSVPATATPAATVSWAGTVAASAETAKSATMTTKEVILFVKEASKALNSSGGGSGNKPNPSSKDTELPGRNGALNQAKRDANILRNQNPNYIEKVKMTEAESRGGHVIKDANGKVIETREYHYTNRFGEKVVIQEHSAPHIGSDDPHFNVRPTKDTRNGVFPGTKEHYPFKK